MDKFFHDDFKYKVNMGNKKDQSKEAILAKNEEERKKRLQHKKQTEAAILIQKQLRQYSVNQHLAHEILIEEKIAGNIMALKQLIQKVPQQEKQIIEKGFGKIILKINIALNSIRSKMLITKLQNSIADLYDLAIRTSKYINDMDFGINKDHYELLIFYLMNLSLKAEFKKSQIGLQLYNASINFLNEYSNSRINVDNTRDINDYFVQKNHSILSKIFQENHEMTYENLQNSTVQHWERIILNSNLENTPNSLISQLILDNGLINLFSDESQQIQFFKQILNPWFENLVYKNSIKELYQLSTILSFMRAIHHKLDINQILKMIRRITQQYLEVVKQIKGNNQNIFIEQELLKYNCKSVIVKVTHDIEKLILVYQKEGQADKVDINTSSKITSLVLQLMKLLDIKEQYIEREIVFRSSMLINLCVYLQDTYIGILGSPNQLIEQVRSDLDLFNLFLHILQQRLIVLDDLEFLNQKKSTFHNFLNQDQSRFIADLLNRIAFKIFQNEQSMNEFDKVFKDYLKQCISRLYDRDRRLNLYPKDFWIVDKNLINLADRLRPSQLMSGISPTLFQNAQQTIPFELRALIFRDLLQEEKDTRQSHMFSLLHSEGVEIRREYMLEDAFEKMYGLGEDIKNKLRIQFVDLNYITEEGIDGGGLFKEFMTKLTEHIFNPQYAFFSETTDRKLHPNYLSQNQQDYDHYYKFFGMIVGKAIYEGVLIKASFAKFFLNKFADKSNNLDDLKTYDTELYNNLMYLKYYEGDAEDLGLTFSINEDLYGHINHIPLVPNGANIGVTNENKIQYIISYANYVLNMKTRVQVQAFQEGLYTVISKEYLSLFFPDEIQLLISGGKNEIDVEDLRRNTVYHGFRDNDPYIIEFWNFLRALPNEEKEKFLVFVTGTNRGPLLGFKYLNPQFCIHQILLDRGEQRFPTASTCMNMLKLPHYGDSDKMKEVLSYAINSNAGFNLE